MPDKTFNFHRTANTLAALVLPAGTTAAAALQRVLRLPSVCSKRFLTNKVDRHVTGAHGGMGAVSHSSCQALFLPCTDANTQVRVHCQ